MQWDLPLQNTMKNVSHANPSVGSHHLFKEWIEFSTTLPLSASIVILIHPLIIDPWSVSSATSWLSNHPNYVAIGSYSWLTISDLIQLPYPYCLTTCDWTHPSGIGELLGSRFQEAQAALIRSDYGQRLPGNGHSFALWVSKGKRRKTNTFLKDKTW